MAKSLGIGSCTLSKSRYIEKHADKKLKQELRDGKKSIDGVYRKLKAQKWDYIGCFPKNSYRVFYADFWEENRTDHEDPSLYVPQFGIYNTKNLRQLPVKEFINKTRGQFASCGHL
jgi:hypothetical protein